MLPAGSCKRNVISTKQECTKFACRKAAFAAWFVRPAWECEQSGDCFLSAVLSVQSSAVSRQSKKKITQQPDVSSCWIFVDADVNGLLIFFIMSTGFQARFLCRISKVEARISRDFFFIFCGEKLDQPICLFHETRGVAVIRSTPGLNFIFADSPRVIKPGWRHSELMEHGTRRLFVRFEPRPSHRRRHRTLVYMYVYIALIDVYSLRAIHVVFLAPSWMHVYGCIKCRCYLIIINIYTASFTVVNCIIDSSWFFSVSLSSFNPFIVSRFSFSSRLGREPRENFYQAHDRVRFQK